MILTNFIKQNLKIILITFALIFPTVVAIPAQAQLGGQIKEGATATDPATAAANPDAGARVDSTVRVVVNAFSWVVGIVSVIMIIVGGVKYITSSGDSGNVTSAKNTILYAVIGLVVVAMAQIIVLFVLDQVA